MQYSLVRSHYVWRLNEKGEKLKMIESRRQQEHRQRKMSRAEILWKVNQRLEFSSFREGMQNFNTGTRKIPNSMRHRSRQKTPKKAMFSNEHATHYRRIKALPEDESITEG